MNTMNTILTLLLLQAIAFLLRSLIRRYLPECVAPGYTLTEFNRFGLRIQHVSQPVDWLKIAGRIFPPVKRAIQATAIATLLTACLIGMGIGQHFAAARTEYAYVAN